MDHRILGFVLLVSFVGSGLCAGKRPYDFPGKRDWDLMPMPKPDFGVAEKETENPIFCEVCKLAVSDLQSLLGNDSSKIVTFLDSICDELPAEFAATCKQYVDGWTPFIIDFLEKSTPEEICEDITLCSAVLTKQQDRLRGSPFGHFVKLFKRVFKTNIDTFMIRQALGDDYLCQGCNEVVSALHAELTNTQLLDELVMLLLEGCAICPVEPQCRAAVQKLPAEIKAFADKYLNNQTCAVIGLCPASDVDPTEPMGLFSRIFTGFLPDNLDMDFSPDQFRPRPRHRPDTEPAPRGHYFRDFDRRNHTHGLRQWSHGEHRDHDHNDHSGGHHNRTHHTRPEGHDNPHRHDHQHRGPHHGHRPVDTPGPRPDVRPWWKPVMKPFWPRPENNCTRPTKPLYPTRPNKTRPAPRPEVPDLSPELERPERPVIDTIPQIGDIDPKKTYVPRIPEYRPDRLGRPSPENRWNPFPKNRSGEKKGSARRGPNRQRRSVVIDSINAENFDKNDLFDVENVLQEPEVGYDWHCEMCEYTVGVLETYMLEHSEEIQDRLMTVANSFCERLPEATIEECKNEVADLLSGIALSTIEKYVTPDKVCPFMKVC